MEQVSLIILYVYIAFFSFFFILYIPRMLYYVGAFPPVKRVTNPKKSLLAVVICAREEGDVIKGVLDSLMSQDYDPEYFDIYVVVNGDSDPTIPYVKAYEKAEIISVPNQQNKGEALDKGLKSILKKNKDYAAYVFIDADNIADKSLLTEMNNALSLDKQLIVGKKLIKNLYSNLPSSRSFSSDSTSLTYTQIDDLGNRARNILGAPIMIVGTGLMVRSDIIKLNNGWPYRCLTEDYELGGDAIVKGWSSYYYPYAKVYTEEATEPKGAYRRRIRWIKGYSQVHSKYRKAILKTKKAKWWVKVGYVFGRNPIYGMFGGSFAFSFIGLVLLILSPVLSFSYIIPLILFLVPLAVNYLLLMFFNLITVITDNKNLPISVGSKLKIIFVSPFYNLTYLPIYLTCLFTSFDHFSWEKTPRIQFEKDEKKL